MTARPLIALVVLLLGAAACGSRAPDPAPVPAPEPARRLVRAESRRLTAAEIDSIRARGTHVDTILVTPGAITLRVGELFRRDALQVRALDASGETIEGFRPVWIAPRSGGQHSVYFFDAPGLRAVEPGEGVVYLEALPRDASLPPSRPSTAVRIVVRP